jgi:GDP-mannose 6-dehydrogenase
MPRRTTQHFAGIPQPGFAFGVSRLPKVLHTTSYLAKVHDVELPMLDNILQPNRITWT